MNARNYKIKYFTVTVILPFVCFKYTSSWANTYVSLSPATTELLIAFGEEKNIRGVPEGSDDLLNGSEIQSVGAYGHPNIEKIIKLKPTLVVGYKEGIDNYSHLLTKAKIDTLFLGVRRLEDFPTAVTELGKKISKPDTAQKIIRDWDQKWKMVPRLPRPLRIVLQIDVHPLILSGGDTFVSQTFEKCGAINVFKSHSGYFRLSEELIPTTVADLVVGLLMTTESNVPTSELTQLSQIFHKQWENQSTKSDNLVMDSTWVARISPRLPERALMVCRQLQTWQNKKTQIH